MLRVLLYILALGMPAGFALVWIGRYRRRLAAGENDEVSRWLDSAINAVLAGDWQTTASAAEKLSLIWRKTGYRQTQAKNKNDPTVVTANLSRLRNAGAARNKADALQALSDLRDCWEGRKD